MSQDLESAASPWPARRAAPMSPLFVRFANAAMVALLCAWSVTAFLKSMVPALPALVAAPGLILVLHGPLSRWAAARAPQAPMVLWLSFLFLAPSQGCLAAVALERSISVLVGESEGALFNCVLLLAVLLLLLGGIPGHLLQVVVTRLPRPRLIDALWGLALAAVSAGAALGCGALWRLLREGSIVGPRYFPVHSGAGWLCGPLLMLGLVALALWRERGRRRLLAVRGRWRTAIHDGQGRVLLGQGPPRQLPAGAGPPPGPVVVLAEDEQPPSYRDAGGGHVILVAAGTADALAGQLRSEGAGDAALVLCAAVLLCTPLFVCWLGPPAFLWP